MSINGERVNKLWCVPAAAGRRNVGPGTRGADGRVPHELRAEGPSKRSMCCTSIYGKLRTGQPSRPPALGTGAPGRGGAGEGAAGPGGASGGTGVLGSRMQNSAGCALWGRAASRLSIAHRHGGRKRSTEPVRNWGAVRARHAGAGRSLRETHLEQHEEHGTPTGLQQSPTAAGRDRSRFPGRSPRPEPSPRCGRAVPPGASLPGVWPASPPRAPRGLPLCVTVA